MADTTEDTTRQRRLNWLQKSAIVVLWLIFLMLCVFGWIGSDLDKERRAGEVRQGEAIIKASKDNFEWIKWHHLQMRHHQKEAEKMLKAIDARLKRLEKAEK